MQGVTQEQNGKCYMLRMRARLWLGSTPNVHA